MPPLPRSLVACALALLGACSAPKPVLRTAPAKAVNGAWGFAVYPALLRFRASGFEAFARGRAVAEELSALTGRTVYGPGEFRIEDPETPDLRRGTNLLGALRFSKDRRPEDLYGVRLVVEQRVTSVSAAAFDSAGNARGAGGRENWDVVVRLELLSVGERRVVADIDGVARVDPFAIDPEKDPYPDVTRLTRELLAALVEQTGLAGSQRAPLGLATVAVPGPALAYQPPNGPSEREVLAKLDAIEQDARLYGLLKQLDPDAPRARLRTYKSAPTGIVVLAAEGAAAEAGLLADDLILQCDGENVTGRHVIDRHLASGEAKLKVKRAGEELEVRLTAPKKP